MKDEKINLKGHGLKIQKQDVYLNIRKNSFTHRVVMQTLEYAAQISSGGTNR